MTEEQIIEEAKNYSTFVGSHGKSSFGELYDTFIEGAHSRDEEIKEMKDELESLRKGFYERGDKLKELMFANNKLRNPWISVTKQLPNDGEKVNVAIRWVHGEILYDSDVYHEDTGWEGYDNDDVIAWMPIPELKKGE